MVAANVWTNVLQKYLNIHQNVVAKWLTIAMDEYTSLIFNQLHPLSLNATQTANVAIVVLTELHSMEEFCQA